MPTFYSKLVPPRATFALDLTPAERDAMQRHQAYWRQLMDRGTRVHALGPVLDPAGSFGVGIIDAADAAAMLALTRSDPAIVAGIGLHYEIHPMPRGVLHSA